MKIWALLAAGVMAASLARAEKDAFAGWTAKQLKVKVLQLQKENQELKEKLLAAKPAEGSDVNPAAAVLAKGNLLLDDFEADLPSNGMNWWTGCDDNKLGSTLAPQPFVPESGGSPASPGRSGRIKGRMGLSQAPWPWAAMTLFMSNEDMRPYSAMSFYVKGDGATHKVSLAKREAKDFAHPVAEFSAPKDWTKVTLKLSDFAQPSWGAPVPLVYQDVEKIQFMPGANDADFDYQIDDLTLVK